MNIQVKDFHDKKTWNASVEKENPWSFFQAFEWGEIEKTQGSKVWRLGVYDKQILVGMAQTVLIAAKRGKFLHIRHGPVLSPQYVSKSEVWKRLLFELTALASKEKAWFIRVSPTLSDSPANKTLLYSLGFTPSPIQAMDAEICWILDLEKEESEMLAGMRKTTRYSIRQAEKVGVKIKKSQNISDFMKLYAETAKRHEFVPHRGLIQEFQEFLKSDKATLLLAEYKGEMLAGALIEFFGSRAIYHHGASIQTKIPASYLLQWAAIKEAKKRGFTYYNFWGIAPHDKPNHPWNGISLFKRGFGGQEKQFLHAHDLILSPKYALTMVIETVRKLKRGY